jgi:hypothetical protein
MSDVDRIRAASDRAIASMRQPRILVETAPIPFSSKPRAPMPKYLRPDFGMPRPLPQKA